MTTPHPRRRFFRYSLRTLLIVVTVFCVWLGVIAKQARDQRQAMELIWELGGEVAYEYQIGQSEPLAPEWLRQLIGDEYFLTVYEVSLAGLKLHDRDLEAINWFTDVKTLFLFDMQITDAGLVHLKGLTKLDMLSLENTQITDAGLEHLKGLTKLQWLSLEGTQITDAGLEHLRGLTNLFQLRLTDTQCTEDGIEKLQQVLPKCQIFYP